MHRNMQKYLGYIYIYSAFVGLDNKLYVHQNVTSFFIPRIILIFILQTRRFSRTNIRITYIYIVLYSVREIGFKPSETHVLPVRTAKILRTSGSYRNSAVS
jgi:hypothetical protein